MLAVILVEAREELGGFLLEVAEDVVGRVGAARGAAEDEEEDDEYDGCAVQLRHIRRAGSS